MNPSTTRPERTSSPISRRTVVVGTAWAVPAVVVASAAPALAASGVTVSVGGICIGTGNTLRIQLVISNPTGASGTVSVNSLTVGNVALATGGIGSLSFGAGATSTVSFSVPNLGLTAGATVAYSVGYSVVIAGVTTTGTASGSLTISGVGNCPF